LSAVRLGESEVTDQPVDLAAVEPPAPSTLTMVVTNATGEVSGSVGQASGVSQRQPVPNARIVLFADDERQWTPHSRSVKSVVAAADGTFTVPSVLPGRYLVAASPWMDAGAWLDPDTLRRLRDAAQRVIVEPRGKSTVSIAIGGDR